MNFDIKLKVSSILTMSKSQTKADKPASAKQNTFKGFQREQRNQHLLLLLPYIDNIVDSVLDSRADWFLFSESPVVWSDTAMWFQEKIMDRCIAFCGGHVGVGYKSLGEQYDLKMKEKFDGKSAAQKGPPNSSGSSIVPGPTDSDLELDSELSKFGLEEPISLCNVIRKDQLLRNPFRGLFFLWILFGILLEFCHIMTNTLTRSPALLEGTPKSKNSTDSDNVTVTLSSNTTVTGHQIPSVFSLPTEKTFLSALAPL